MCRKKAMATVVKTVRVLNYSGEDVVNIIFSQQPGNSGAWVIRDMNKPLKAGDARIYKLNIPEIDTVAYYQMTSQNSSYFLSGCLQLGDVVNLLVANTQIDTNTVFYASSCPTPVPGPYPGYTFNFIEGSKYWPMDKAAYDNYLKNRLGASSLVGYPSVASISALTPMTLPPSGVDLPDDPPVVAEESTSYTWLWVVILVLVLLIVTAAIAGGIYYYRKRR
jgi:hypothetical protein